MSLHRHDAKRDANEPEIVKALEAVGATVFRLSAKDIPDLLVVYRGQAYFIEVKMPGEKPREGQRDFLELVHDGTATVVTDVEAALRHIGAVE